MHQLDLKKHITGSPPGVHHALPAPLTLCLPMLLRVPSTDHAKRDQKEVEAALEEKAQANPSSANCGA